MQTTIKTDDSEQSNLYDKSDEETSLKIAVSPIKENNTEAANITVTSSIQGNCDTKIQLTTTNSLDVSILKVILNRLEGLEGTFVKMVEKICSRHDDNVNEKLENKVKSLSEDKESLGEANALRNKLSTTEKRCEELQSLLHNIVLEKEMLKSKFESQISVLQNKADYAEKRIVQLNKEVDTLEEIVESKHSQLAHQEKRSTSPKPEICKLQDENNNVQLSQQENPNDWQTHNTKQKQTSQKEQSTHKKNPNNISKQERSSEKKHEQMFCTIRPKSS